jgi:hypothetical protein
MDQWSETPRDNIETHCSKKQWALLGSMISRGMFVGGFPSRQCENGRHLHCSVHSITSWHKQRNRNIECAVLVDVLREQGEGG